MNENYIIGLMSGTSLDGLDIAYCKFVKQEIWSFDIIQSKTVRYDDLYRQKLKNAYLLTDFDLEELSLDFGRFMAKELSVFITEYFIEQIDAIGSHGHTVFHQPENGITHQIGDPRPLYDLLHKPVIYDFRSQDVLFGGQGAPLVPIVDKLLFSNYDACLNIGGFSNISFDHNGRRVAFDICPANIVLNFLANKIGLEYDDKGTVAAQGEVNEDLLTALNSLEYYKKKHPKSLGWEWVQENVFYLFEKYELSISSQLRTFVEHIAVQVSAIASSYNFNSILFSGGGVYNDFLINRLEYFMPHVCIKPNKSLIDGKEAMAFAFLGLLRFKNQINVLSSVTGSNKDHCSGKIYPKEL